MKKVLEAYTSKNDINIKQIVAYKDNELEIEEYKRDFNQSRTKVPDICYNGFI